MFQPTEETREREALEPIQLERLRATIARIAAAQPRLPAPPRGIAAGDLASLDDLPRLPFLTKDQLRDAYPYGMACHGPEPVQPGPHVLRNDGRADRQSVHDVRSRAVARRHGALAGGGGRDGAGRTTGDGVLRPVHWRLRVSLRGRGARGDGDPGGSGTDSPSAPAPAGSPGDRPGGDRDVPPPHDRGGPAGRIRLQVDEAPRGRPGLGAVVGRAARPDRVGDGRADLRPHRDDGDGRARDGHRVRRPRRHPRVGRPLSARDRGTGDRPGPARTASGASWS